MMYWVVACILIFVHVQGREPTHDVQLKLGNLALPSSQQPGPLFCFGQTIVDKHDFLGYAYIDYLRGVNQRFAEVVPSFLYGINDHSTLYVAVPVAAQFQSTAFCSSGIEDIYAQYEYAFYTKTSRTASNQATVVAGLSLPTGSTRKKPPTGGGSAAFLLGLTASHLSIDWYLFTSCAGLIPTKQPASKSQLIYQGGIGRNIVSPRGLIITLVMELNGTFNGSPIVRGRSQAGGHGSNTIFIGPCLWVSSERFTLQAGIGGACAQKTPPGQPPNRYIAALNLGWKFHTGGS
jgi:hypothetical protein